MIHNRARLIPVILLAAILLAACGGGYADPPPTVDSQSAEAAASVEAASTGEAEPEAAAATSALTEIPPTATPEDPFPGEGPWPVTFETADGLTLSGTVYGEGQTALVLVPMYPGGQPGWQGFAEQAAEAGYRAMTFDLRGQGESEGEASLAEAASDVEAAAAFLREQAAGPIILMGAGTGTIPAIQAAPQSEAAGVAVLSPLLADSGVELTDADLQALTMPTLWLGARVDMTQQVEEMSEQAASADKEAWLYEGTSLRGTYLFEGADAADVTSRLLAFVASTAGN